MVQSQCLTRYLKKKCWESQLKGKTHNESLGKQGPRSTRGTRQRQCWALIYSQEDTAHGEPGAAWKKAEDIRARAFKKCIAWKRTSETELWCWYDRHQMDVLRVNPLVIHQLFCVTHWYRCEGILGAERGSSLGSGLWLPHEMSPCNSSPNLSSCSNPSSGRGHNWSFGHVNLARFPKSG